MKKLLLLLLPFLFISNVRADTYNPSSALQYYEFYQSNTKKETSFQYGDNILLSSPNAVNYPYAMSLILNGNYIKGKTYTLNANLSTFFETDYFKFYYENLNYLVVSAQLVNGTERTLCNLQPITQNVSYSISCTFEPKDNLDRIVLSLINYDYQNNGYVPFGAGDYVRFTNYNMSIYDNSSDIIINQNETIINQNNQTNENLEDINNSLTDTTPPDTSGLNGAAGWLPPGPVDSLINLPLSFFNSISRDLGSSCKPVNLPLPYVKKNLTLPCMSSFYEGIKINSFMDWLGLIASGFILFSYLLKLYKWVDDTLTFRENNHLDNWGGV